MFYSMWPIGQSTTSPCSPGKQFLSSFHIEKQPHIVMDHIEQEQQPVTSKLQWLALLQLRPLQIHFTLKIANMLCPRQVYFQSIHLWTDNFVAEKTCCNITTVKNNFSSRCHGRGPVEAVSVHVPQGYTCHQAPIIQKGLCLQSPVPVYYI